MRAIIMLLVAAAMAQGGVLRVSKVAPLGGLNTEAVRFTKDGRVMILHVEKEVVVTGAHVEKATVVPKMTGVIEVELNKEGAKRLAEATKGAAGKLRLAIIVDEVVESIPLVQGELKGKFWISGLENLEKEDLKALAEALMNADEEEEEEEAEAEAPNPLAPQL